jgi:hypothetical protein
MPNHVHNRLEILGSPEEVTRIREAIKGGPWNDGGIAAIDFNKIIPMPAVLRERDGIMHIPTGLLQRVANGEETAECAAEEWAKATKTSAVVFPSLVKQIDWQSRCLHDTGFTSWYDWSVENWGTKWNAYGTPDRRDTDSTIWFDTAWSVPQPVIEALTAMFPEVTFCITWADEDTGNNCGSVTLRNGEMLSHQIPVPNSREAYEIAFALNPGISDLYELVDGRYEYKEEALHI